MKLKFLSAAVAGLILSVCSIVNVANAGLIQFTGTLATQNEYVLTMFTLSADGTVRGWTDSYNNNANFDPITTLWAADGSYIFQNDDNPNINPSTQTIYDSGFSTFLNAGTYYFTISVYNNFANNTGNILTGNPFPGLGVTMNITDWYATANNVGGFYSLWLDGVDTATSTVASASVPEPSSFAIFALGLLGLAVRRFKKQ